MAGKKVYAVRRGRQTGLFNTWAECEKQVAGFPGARFKGFTSAAEAMAWLAGDDSAGGATAGASRSVASSNTRSTANTRGARYSARTGGAGAQEALFAAPAEDMTPPDYIIYTDGSCLRNPDGPGGWAAVVLDLDMNKITELHGGAPSTTNNRMELTAAIGAMSYAAPGATVDLYTDSQYLKNAFTKNWLAGWKRKGWVTASREPVKNQDLWRELDALYSERKIRFHWVKGHVGVEHNERCDVLARSEAMKYMR